MSTLITYSYENKRYANKKRILKHNKLLKELYFKLAKEVIGNSYKKIKFRLTYKELLKGNTSTFRFRYKKINLEVTKMSIKLDLPCLTKIVFCGFSNDYYNCRRLTLNTLKNNRKNARLFFLYHELYHAKQLIDNGVYGFKQLTRFQKESQADRFALRKIIKNQKDNKKAVKV